MIQANELRHGVWVLENGLPHQISYHDHDWFHTDLFEPIPLTPEILEKCGFVEDVAKCKGFHPGLLFKLLGGRETTIRFFMIDGYAALLFRNQRFIDIHSLHQLQNLYFALTGEELNYTP